MKILVFGNEFWPSDSLPLRLLPELRREFSRVKFQVVDPSELEALEGGDWIILDAVEGLKEPRVLGLEDLMLSVGKPLSVHGFDLGVHLRWLQKIKKIDQLKIIGVPMSWPAKRASPIVSEIIASLPSFAP